MTTKTYVARIDRVDTKGNLREHLTGDGERTLCGLLLRETQKPAGNAVCRRCQQLVATTEGGQ